MQRINRNMLDLTGYVNVWREQVYTATAGQTDFKLPAGITYPVNRNMINVFLNGDLQRKGLDYTEFDNTTIKTTEGLRAGDVVHLRFQVPYSEVLTTWPEIKIEEAKKVANVMRQQTFTVTEGQTVFSLNEQYAPGTYTLSVFLNGIKQRVGIDYLETDNGKVTFTVGLKGTDRLEMNWLAPSGQFLLGTVKIEDAPDESVPMKKIAGLTKLNRAVTEVGYLIADDLGLVRFKTREAAQAATTLNNAALLKPYLDSRSKIKFLEGYYPFEKELVIGSNSLVGSGKTLTELVFNNSRGLVYGKSGYFSNERISELSIYSKGHCIDYKNDVGTTRPNNVYQMDISKLWLYSVEGHCVYGGDNRGIGADQLVFEQRFSEIRVSAPMGSGFFGIGGLNIRYEYISDAFAIKNVFQNCYGKFAHINTSFAGAEYFLFFDANCPANYNVILDMDNVNMETIKNAGIRIESSQILVKNLILKNSGYTPKPTTGGVLFTEPPIYIPDLSRLELENATLGKYPTGYDTTVVKAPIHCWYAAGGMAVSVESISEISIYSALVNDVVVYNKFSGFQHSLYDYRYGKRRFNMIEELQVRTLKGARARYVTTVSDRKTIFNNEELSDEYAYALTTDLTIQNLYTYGSNTAGSNKVTLTNKSTSTANLIISPQATASSFITLGNQTLTITPGQSLDFVYKNNRWVQVVTADRLITTSTTALRPTTPFIGQSVFDSTLGKPIWYNGSVWKDSTGTTV